MMTSLCISSLLVFFQLRIGLSNMPLWTKDPTQGSQAFCSQARHDDTSSQR